MVSEVGGIASDRVFDVAVLIATYNSDLLKTVATIESVLMQTECDVQIVVADDGSSTDNFTAISELFSLRSFESYVLVSPGENCGTVKNLLHAMPFVKAPIVKLLSPGDYLYRATTLHEIIHSMSSSESSACFGRAVFYSPSGIEGVRVLPVRNPAVEGPYTQRPTDLKRAKRYQIVYGDWILGASLAYKTCKLTECLKMMANRIVLTEDAAARIILANGEGVSFIQDYVVWYEWGTGVSTSAAVPQRNSMIRDYTAQVELFAELYPDDKDVKRMIRNETDRASGMPRILRAARDPARTAFQLWKRILQLAYHPHNADFASYQETTKRGEMDYALLCDNLKMDASLKGVG